MSTDCLTDLHVLELGAGVSSAFASRLLGDHGAEVVKVESPEGDWTRRRGPFPGAVPDPERSGLFLAINTNKRGVRLDLTSDPGREELGRLLDWADILVQSHGPEQALATGTDAESLEARRPDLVTLSMTPFGVMGPYARYRAHELTTSAAGGWANLSPAATGNPELPPLKIFGHQCAFMSGVAGATVAMAACSAARRTGVGEFIDFSEQAYTASVLENAIPQYSYAGVVATRYGPRRLIPWSIFQCSDGPLFVACMEQDQWERLVEQMGSPEWASLEVFATPPDRARNFDILHSFVQEWLADRSAFETYHELQRHRICAAPVMSLGQIAESEHLKARDAFTEVEHSGAGPVRHLAPVARVEGTRLAVRRGAPRLGEHDGEVLGGRLPARAPVASSGDSSLPLKGIRGADLSWAWAGPFCAMNLAHLGAEVVRFESAERPDLYRRLNIHPRGIERTLDSAGMFNQWNQGKKSVALNLGEPRAREVLQDFIATCDVVVQNFATGVMERLGLGYEALAERNPGLVLASISGYGQTGPLSRYMGYGPAIGPLTGLAVGTGFVGGRPSEIGVSMPDPNAGITAAFEICAALEKRRESGRGRHIDISLWEATAAFAVEAWMDYAMNGEEPVRQGSRDASMSPHGFFRTRGEDEWISIACASDEEWRVLCALLAPELESDARFTTLDARKDHEDALEAELSQRTQERDRWELTRLLQGRGVAAFPAMTAQDIVEDPHFAARGFIERLPHPVVGARAHAGVPYLLRRRPNGVQCPAPVLGADTEEVLCRALGHGADEIRVLREDKILY
jgi:crotonobetainyl-CoA:carnitine CoA-transferase CaiB-like acyl-CoA transferase